MLYTNGPWFRHGLCHNLTGHVRLMKVLQASLMPGYYKLDLYHVLLGIFFLLLLVNKTLYHSLLRWFVYWQVEPR